VFLETSSIQGNLSQLQFEMEQATDRLASLREKCAAAAVQVATAVHRNEEQRAKIPARVTLQTMHPASNSSADVDDGHTIQQGLPMTATATVTLRQRQQLERLQKAIQDEAMMTSIQEAQSQVRRLRWQWALQAFAMHRLDAEEPANKKPTMPTSASTGKGAEGTATTTSSSSSSNNTNSRKQARGIGKIGGLPLPHAGPELYGVLPPNELQSALRLTSSVTASVARCLGIILPHPVLLQPGDSPIRDIVEMAVQHTSQRQHAAPHGNTTRDTNNMDDGDVHQQQEVVIPESTSTSTAAFLSSSTASLASLMGQTAKKAIARATGQQLLEETVAQVAIPITMEPALVQQRLHHAVAAVLAEANTSSTPSNNGAASAMGNSCTASTTRYALSATATASDKFAIALQLLQNNIVALCIRAGVPVTALWPAEAVLLNLHALQVYCREQLSQ
jgi:hypothetical protein